MGDFNFRTHSKLDYLISIKPNFEELRKLDESIEYKNSIEFFNNFKEGDILFIPTYKYKKDTNIFDFTKKHSPSWCDRIFYYDNDSNNILLKDYFSIMDCKQSDHRPVAAYFEYLLNIYG